MKKRFFFNLSIVAVAFALILGFGTFNVAKAVPGESGERYNLPPGQVNSIGADHAVNSFRIISRDSDSKAYEFAPDTYGLGGTLRN